MYSIHMSQHVRGDKKLEQMNYFLHLVCREAGPKSKQKAYAPIAIGVVIGNS